MLKLTLQHSKNGCCALPQAGEGDYGVRKRSFRPMLKLTLQHSKTATPLSHSVGEGLGVRANA
jgi:hypothetical protein